MEKINGKTIWITGASSGIGEGLVYALARKSCKLIISSRRAEKLEQVKQKCDRPENVYCLPLDLANLHAMQDKVEKALGAFGKIDMLINNAGLSQRALIIDTDITVFKSLIDINYLGTVALTKALLPEFLKNKKGHFVTVTSLMGKFGSPYRSGYCAAKHALHGFFDVLRMEHEKDGVTVTMICPGFVNTEIARNALIGDGSAQRRNDTATENGLSVESFAKQTIKAVECEKFEVYIGKKEIMGAYLKRLSNRLLHKIVLNSKVK